VVGTCTPGQAQGLIQAGYIKECVLWNPVDSGYAMVAVAKMMLEGKDNQASVNIPGVGEAKFDAARKVVQLSKMLETTKSNVDNLVSQGL